MQITPLHHALRAFLGQTLTPEVAAAIVTIATDTTVRPIPLEQFAPLDVDGYVLHVERFAEALPELRGLHAAHWQETEKHRLGLPLDPDYDAIAYDDATGGLLQFTVRRDGVLVGHLRMYLRTSRHTRTRLAIEDTLYVAPEHRNATLGLQLLRYAERCLRAVGVREIEADSKLVNHADVLLRRMGYAAVALKFAKVFKENDDVQ